MSTTARTLIITNDFPPRTGGIQTYVHSLASRLPTDSVVVYASDHPGTTTAIVNGMTHSRRR